MSVIAGSKRRVAPSRLNPFTPEFLGGKNPYPLLHELRAFAPVAWIADAKLWAVTSYKEAEEVLKNPRLRTFFSLKDGHDFTNENAFVRAMRWAIVLSASGEHHQRLRPLFADLMAPKVVSQWRAELERTAHRLIDRVESARRIDILKDYGMALPFELISDVLGVPNPDRPQAMRWMEMLFGGIRDLTYNINDEQVLAIANQATVELNAYVASMIAARRRTPRGDILDRMILAAQKNSVSDEELCVSAWVLYLGGVETTGTVTASGILRLFQNPDALKAVKNDPNVLRGAIQEMLRCDVPSFITARVCDEDTMVGDQRVSAGEQVSIILGAANYDPQRFPDPDRFDITRNTKGISFGIGPHMCVGQLLARMSMEVAITVLFQRLPDLKLDDLDPPRTPAISGGLLSLPASW